MNITSSWPLPPEGVRFLVPPFIAEQLAINPLTQGLYPTAMGYYPVANNHRMQRPVHTDYLMIYCIAGKGTLMAEEASGTKRYRIVSGDLILLPPNHPHTYQADNKDPWTIYWLHFDGEVAQQFYEHLQMTSLRFNIGVQPRVVRIFDALSELHRSGYLLAEFIQGCHQLQALLSYASLLVRQQQPQAGRQALNWDRIRAMMQEHVHGQLNLDDLAAEAQLSKYHFSKKFKALTGHSPIRYFINMKMQRACYLLDSSSRSVKQVSAVLGYDDVYYFSRLFKKVMGLSPDQYRKSKFC